MRRKHKPRLEIGKDYTINERGRAVFTRDYLLKLGECCGKNCNECPYPSVEIIDTKPESNPLPTESAPTAIPVQGNATSDVPST